MKRSVCIILIFGAALSLLSGTAPGVFRSVLKSYLALDESRFGLLLGIGTFAGSIGALLAGVAARKTGPSNLLKPLFLVTGIGYAAVAFSDGFATAMLGLGLCGFGAQALITASQGALAAAFPDAKRQVLAWQMVASSVASMGFAFLCELILSWSNNNQARFGLMYHVAFMSVALCLFLCAPAFPKPSEEPGTEAKPEGLGGAIGSMPVILSISALTLHSLADNLLYPWIPRLLEQKEYASFKPGYVLLAYSLAYVVSRTLLGFLKEKTFRRTFLCVPGFAGGLLIATGIMIGGRAMALAYIGGAFLWSTEYPAMLALLAGQVSKKLFTVCIAIVLAVSGVLTSIFSWLFGLALDRGILSLAQMFLFPAALFVVCGAIGVLQSFRARNEVRI